ASDINSTYRPHSAANGEAPPVIAPEQFNRSRRGEVVPAGTPGQGSAAPLLEGAAYALEQCGLLLRDADPLYQSGSYASVIALAAFAQEEKGIRGVDRVRPHRRRHDQMADILRYPTGSVIASS